MLEKIIKMLKAQRDKYAQENGGATSITDRSLQDMAKTLVPLITDDETLNKADFMDTFKTIEGNISHVSANAVNKYKEDTQKKTSPPTPPNPNKKEPTEIKTDENTPVHITQMLEQLKLIADQNKVLTDEVFNLKNDKETSFRTGKVEKALKDMPTPIQKTFLESFKATKFDKDEDFDAYLTGLGKNVEELSQMAKESGLNFASPPTTETQTPQETGQTPVLQKAGALVKKAKEEAAKAEV